MWSAVSSRVFPWPLHWNQELMLWRGPAFPAGLWSILGYCYVISHEFKFFQIFKMLTLLPMFQVPTNTVIMSGSGFSECLFFICWSSWQNPSLFWWNKKKKNEHIQTLYLVNYMWLKTYFPWKLGFSISRQLFETNVFMLNYHNFRFLCSSHWFEEGRIICKNTPQ